MGGSKTGLVGTAVGIFRQEGVLALWRGVSPGVTRHIIYTGIRISVYDRLRQHISNLNDGHKSHKQLQLHHRQALTHWNTSKYFIYINSPTRNHHIIVIAKVHMFIVSKVGA